MSADNGYGKIKRIYGEKKILLVGNTFSKNGAEWSKWPSEVTFDKGVSDFETCMHLSCFQKEFDLISAQQRSFLGGS